jgi:transcriptional regulator with XRE-family HTH domain
MRIKLNNSKIFFDEILEKEKLSLKQLSKKLNIGYSALKSYRRGELFIPKKIFEEIFKLSDNKKYWLNQIEEYSDNWWVSKAGKISASKDIRNKRIAYARKFKKIPKLNIKINEFFCEFYGALIGDGCISRFKREKGERIIISIVGNKKLDSDYLKYLKDNLKKEFNINCYYYEYKNRNVCSLAISNKKFALFLSNIGFPIGKKCGRLKIPNSFFRLDWKFQKMIIRGIFDTDGSICAKKREGYKYPQISLSSQEDILKKQIYKILRKRGYPCWIFQNNIYIRSNISVKKWFEDIGSSNQRNILKYNYWLNNKILPPNILG